jgi:hypothetical protein
MLTMVKHILPGCWNRRVMGSFIDAIAIETVLQVQAGKFLQNAAFRRTDSR